MLLIVREVGDRTKEISILNDLSEAHGTEGLRSETDHQRALDNVLDSGDRLQQARAMSA